MNEKIIKLFRSGLTRRQIASKLHVQTFVIQQALNGFPTNKIVNKINTTYGFKD